MTPAPVATSSGKAPTLGHQQWTGGRKSLQSREGSVLLTDGRDSHVACGCYQFAEPRSCDRQPRNLVLVSRSLRARSSSAHR